MTKICRSRRHLREKCHEKKENYILLNSGKYSGTKKSNLLKVFNLQQLVNQSNILETQDHEIKESQ